MSDSHDKGQNLDSLSPAPRAAALIRLNQEDIINQWLKAVLETIPAARQQGYSELTDHLLEMLNDIAESLRLLGDDQSPARVEQFGFIDETCVSHGRERATVKDFSAVDLLQEYALLRQVITGFCQPNQADDIRTIDIISRVIDSASHAAVKEFVRAMQEVQQKLIYTLVHDVRTPLGVAHNYAELLASDILTPEQQERAVPTISRNLKRAISMLEELLDVSKLRAGNGLVLHFEKVDLVGPIRLLCQEALIVYDTPIVCAFEDRAIEGVFDLPMILRTVENLVSNAVKFGDEHKPISVILEDLADRVKICVHNEGEPIPEQHKDEIFRTFSSPHKRTDIKKGWGLGLSLIKTIAMSHGGSIILESEKEGGTSVGMLLKKDYRKPGEEQTMLL